MHACYKRSVFMCGQLVIVTKLPTLNVAEGDSEESQHRGGEDSVPEQRAGEGQDPVPGPGDRGGARAGGEHAAAGVAR